MNVSVVIPVFNRPRRVCRAIDSVLGQSRPAPEIIVVDDGSSDTTARSLQKYGGQIHVVRHDKNRGVSAARNSGIEKARGEWIALLDSDDEWMTHKLEKQEAFFRARPELQIAQCQEIWLRRGKRVNPKKKHRKFGGFIFRESLPLCIVSPSAVMFKKSLWAETGGFDENFPVCEDYDLWLRITRQYPIGLDEEAGIIKYGGHADQLSRQKPLMDLWRIRAIEKHLRDASFNGTMRVVALQEICKKLQIVIDGRRKRGHSAVEFEESLQRYWDELALSGHDFLYKRSQKK